jgi:hypothetical protein
MRVSEILTSSEFTEYKRLQRRYWRFHSLQRQGICPSSNLFPFEEASQLNEFMERIKQAKKSK